MPRGDLSRDGHVDLGVVQRIDEGSTAHIQHADELYGDGDKEDGMGQVSDHLAVKIAHRLYLRPMRILVIEDERKVASFIKRGLEEERYIVETVADGEAGLDLAMNNHFDAIVLDVMLPKLDGYSVLSALRDTGNATPVLMLTARGTTEDRVQGLDLGADDYLAKPFHFEELAARLRSILRRSSTEKTTKLQCGDLVLDMVTHFAYRGDKEIELTTKEYALLEYLLRHKNRILSRSMIMQHVWKHNFDPESNIIDVYVKRLRTKVERPGAPQIIQSIRGVGYRIREAAEGDDDEPQQEEE